MGPLVCDEALLQLLRDPFISTISIGHRDRLVHFGAKYVEVSLAASKWRLVVEATCTCDVL